MLAGFRRIVFIDIRLGAALIRGKLAITDQAIGPVVDDFYLQDVFASFDGPGYVNPPGRAPDHSQFLSVERHLGCLTHRAEVEIDFRF